LFSIIQIIHSVSSEASGPSYSVLRLCESLLAQGHDVTLAAIDGNTDSTSIPFMKLFPPGLGPTRLGLSPAMDRWLSMRSEKKGVDLIHNHGLWMMPNIYPGRVARKFNIPYVVSPRGTLGDWPFRSGSKAKRLFWPLIQRPALDAVSCFHATAKTEYEDIRKRGFRQPVTVIPNGMDVPEYVPKPSRTERTLLYLGRIHPKKGLDFLLKAWGIVQTKFSDWRLRIVGPDQNDHKNEINRLAKQLRLERLDFSDALFGEKKWDAYREADLFVLPTRDENFGLVVAEALAAGTPAIVTKGAPWPEIESRGAGWWIDIGIDPLVACLEKTLALPVETLAEMGMAGRDWMARDFSWDRVGFRMAETYRWIIDGGDRPEWVIEG